MQAAQQDNDTQGHCPACGFAVFNRRFPNCEKCGAALPAEMVCSSTERAHLFDQERVEAEAQWRERQKEWQRKHGGQAEVATTLVVGEGSGGGALGGGDGSGGGGDCG